MGVQPFLFVKLPFRKRSTAELASCNETQASETESECTEACKSNYPAKQGYIIPVISVHSG